MNGQTAPPVYISLSPSSGNPGTSITIKGTSLSTTKSVLFSGEVANFVVKSDTELSVTIPPTAITGPIRISTSMGTTLTSSFKVTRASSSLSFIKSPSFSYNPFTYNGNKTAEYTTPAFADIDADGLIDMLVGTIDGNIEHYEQTGQNQVTFERRTNNFFNSIIKRSPTPTVTDIDGDGLLDIIIGYYDGFIKVYEQIAKGSTSFNLLNSISLGDLGNYVGEDYAAPTVTDLDGDGLLDILVGTYNGNIQHFEQNVANGLVFNRRTTTTTPFSGINVGSPQGYAQPKILDIDGNGLLDLIVGAYNGVTYHYKQSGSNSLSFTGGSILIPDIGDHASPAFSDLNGDGRLDLVMGVYKGALGIYTQGQSISNPLPVVWVKFIAKENADGVLLNWDTASEENSAFYVVEKSWNGKDFTDIGKVSAANNSNTLIQYQYQDTTPLTGTLYYRLKQVDIDGRSEFSSVIAVQIKNQASQELLYPFPNPATSFTFLNLTFLATKAVSIDIYNMYGVLVKQCTVSGGNMQQIDLSSLTSGKYVIAVRTDSYFKAVQVLKK